jgi:hypothetical protein
MTSSFRFSSLKPGPRPDAADRARVALRQSAVMRLAETVPVKRNIQWFWASYWSIVTVPVYELPRRSRTISSRMLAGPTKQLDALPAGVHSIPVLSQLNAK